MANQKIDKLILQMENYLECWKQFEHYLNLARSKKFSPEDESQFLELKSILTQGLEMIMSSNDVSYPSREEIHALISSAASIRLVSELGESNLRNMENQWHKIFIAWQSILGQLKVQQREAGSKSFWDFLFKRKS
ncbi:MAG TPA: hypothetical protein PK256_17945 [Verrucomicrobiota bacterium]|nr:hypothetical protein [Verrucomicrobiota bacterium]